MKSIKNYLFLVLVAAMSLVACKNETSSVKDEARESLASTEKTEKLATNPKKVDDGPIINIASGPTTSMDFMGKEVYDFGTIDEGEVVEHVYKFKNTGNEPLTITNAKGSCGCTVPDWPRTPIAAGEIGEIVVKFNSKGKGKVGGGAQAKKVTITANTEPAQTYLTIKGTVVKQEG